MFEMVKAEVLVCNMVENWRWIAATFIHLIQVKHSIAKWSLR